MIGGRLGVKEGRRDCQRRWGSGKGRRRDWDRGIGEGRWKGGEKG